MNSKNIGTMEVLLIIAVIVQVVSPIVIVSVPFGFDHRSAAGLDFDHLFALAGLWLIATVFGSAAAVANKKWRWAGAHLGLALVGIVVVMIWLQAQARLAHSSHGPARQEIPPNQVEPAPVGRSQELQKTRENGVD
jgi:hypothetical protein